MNVTENVLRIAICDDEKIFLEKIKGLTEHYFAGKNIEVEIQCYQSVEAFLQSDLKSYQIILLDVNMGDINGIEVAHNIREHGIDTPIIYISAYIEMAPKGYTVGAFRYLLKNDLDATFAYTMTEVMDYLKVQTDTLRIKKQDSKIDLKLSEILFFESFKRYMMIHTNDESYKLYGRISDMEKQLEGKGFLRIHKSYLTNMKYISNVKNRVVYLKDGTNLPCSKERCQEILDKFIFWKGK